MKLFALILCISFSLIAHSGQITYVEKDDPMPYSGFAVDKPQMRHFRQVSEEKEVAQQKVIKLEELRFQHEQKIDYLEDEYSKINKAYKSEQRQSTVAKVIYFVGGIFTTGIILYSASKLRNN